MRRGDGVVCEAEGLAVVEGVEGFEVYGRVRPCGRARGRCRVVVRRRGRNIVERVVDSAPLVCCLQSPASPKPSARSR